MYTYAHMPARIQYAHVHTVNNAYMRASCVHMRTMETMRTVHALPTCGQSCAWFAVIADVWTMWAIVYGRGQGGIIPMALRTIGEGTGWKMGARIITVLGRVNDDADVEAITNIVHGNQESSSADQRVILIEANSTGPMLGDILGDARPDIFTGIIGTTVTMDAVNGIIQHSDEHDVDYITAPRFHGCAQVYHQRYLRTIELLAPMYDWIVLLIEDNTELLNHVVPDMCTHVLIV